jgi:hypothetical protein
VLQCGIHRRDVKIHFAGKLWLELDHLQVNDYKAAQLEVVKQQI